MTIFSPFFCTSHPNHLQLKPPLACLFRLLPSLLAACLLLFATACGKEAKRDKVIIVDDDDGDDVRYDSRYYSNNTSEKSHATATTNTCNNEHYDTSSNIDHTYEILKIKQVKRSNNQNIKKWQNPNENAKYYLLWARKGTKFEWQVRIVPEDGDATTQSQFFVDKKKLPPPIKLKHSKSSNHFTFDVNLIDSFDGSDGEKVDVNTWVDNNKQGNIYVQHCKNRNKQNSNTTNSIKMPYHLAFDGNSNGLVCNASETTNIFETTGIAKAAIRVLGRIFVPGSQCKK